MMAGGMLPESPCDHLPLADAPVNLLLGGGDVEATRPRSS